MKQEHIKMPLDFLFNVIQLIYALEGQEVSPEISTYAKSIKTQIKGKFEQIQARDKYTKYKTAKTESERKEAIQEYLDMKGIHEDWRY